MTTEEKLQNFYNHSLDSANREAERVIGDHQKALDKIFEEHKACLLYTSPSPRDRQKSRMPSSA